MTKKQQEFYRILVNQMVDFNEDFHKEFTIKRIERIPDEQLKYLLEDINIDKDKIVRKKGYITYAKFIYYADKIIKENLQQLPNNGVSKVDELYNKREILIQTLQQNTNSISERNKLIENIKAKKSIFEVDGKNILDEVDYYVIEQFGFYNFFDPNKNYMIKEEIEKYLQNYTLKMNKKPTQQLLT